MATDCEPNARKVDKPLPEDVCVQLCACAGPLAACNIRYRLSTWQTLHAATSRVPRVVNTLDKGGGGGMPAVAAPSVAHIRPTIDAVGRSSNLLPLSAHLSLRLSITRSRGVLWRATLVVDEFCDMCIRGLDRYLLTARLAHACHVAAMARRDAPRRCVVAPSCPNLSLA